MNTETPKECDELQSIAARLGADIMLDARTTTVVAFNERANIWVQIFKPLTSSVAEFAALALRSNFVVFVALQDAVGNVTFGPMVKEETKDN